MSTIPTVHLRFICSWVALFPFPTIPVWKSWPAPNTQEWPNQGSRERRHTWNFEAQEGVIKCTIPLSKCQGIWKIPKASGQCPLRHHHCHAQLPWLPTVWGFSLQSKCALRRPLQAWRARELAISQWPLAALTLRHMPHWFPALS